MSCALQTRSFFRGCEIKWKGIGVGIRRPSASCLFTLSLHFLIYRSLLGRSNERIYRFKMSCYSFDPRSSFWHFSSVASPPLNVFFLFVPALWTQEFYLLVKGISADHCVNCWCFFLKFLSK